MAGSRRHEFAIEAVRAAARVITRFDRHRGDLKVMEKEPGDLFTNADLLAEEAVMRMIAEHYPDDGILSEESGQHGPTASCWVLDPLDGTNNFIHGLQHYAVSLAWCHAGIPELGVIYDVCRNELYTAERGRGALCDQRRIRVAGTRRLRDALVVSSGAHDMWSVAGQQTGVRSARIRRLGAATLDFGLVARGAMDAGYGDGLQYWDYAAGSVVLREAGGTLWCGGAADTEAEVAFGERLPRCLFGTARIVGNLRRQIMAQDAADAPDAPGAAAAPEATDAPA